mmetsp:Transcript_26727/g.85840  ORF Transcript_26727/g.85840 Transcript_26727/m.85840 type:complete len:204 (+) Transcript_26727:1615-2226(+)
MADTSSGEKTFFSPPVIVTDTKGLVSLLTISYGTSLASRCTSLSENLRLKGGVARQRGIAAPRAGAEMMKTREMHSLAADEALHVVDGALGVGGGLVLGGVADEALGVGEGDVGRGDAVALVVGDNLNAAVLVDAHARVGGAKIDTDDSAQALLGGLLLGAGARHEGEHGHGRKHEAVHPAEAGLYKRGMARCKSDETPLSSP